MFFVAPELYDSIAKALDVGKNNEISCDSTLNIVFTVGDMDLVLKPDDYIDRREQKDGYCNFMGVNFGPKGFFSLSYAVLRNHCLLLDYKNKQVGFANKK
jgi:hypothetical protein